MYFLRNISSIAARYGKLQKEIQLGNEYLFEREHDVDRFRKVHIKDKLPDFFDNAFGLIEPTDQFAEDGDGNETAASESGKGESKTAKGAKPASTKA